jgi:type IV secretory pathway protease TraF
MKHTRSLSMAAAFAAVVLVLAFSPIVPGWVKSDSIPQGLYLATAYHGSPSLLRGQPACFPYENPAWAVRPYMYKGELLCKYVLGLPGDTVSTAPDGATIICHGGTGGACDNVGIALTHDHAGNPVQHPVWHQTVIPDGSYYMGSTRRRNSLDSRYLGFIQDKKIVKTLVPLLVQQDN